MEPAGSIIRGALLVCAVASAALFFLPASGFAQRFAPPTAAEVRERTRDYVDEHDLVAAGRALRAVPAPRGGERQLFGEAIHVAFYGAPQLTGTVLGKSPPNRAMSRLKRQAKAYRKSGDRPVERTVNLIGVIATADPGTDDLYRTRQSDRIIANYLTAARSIGARLVLDIQPGRASVLDELREMRRWLREPDVDVAIDPEWNVGRKEIPGQDEGSIKAEELNKATDWLDRLIARQGLPPKALVVHQFRDGSVRGRDDLLQGEAVEVLLNFDGIGSPRAKKVGYRRLAVEGIFNGFSLFYDLDERLMKPPSVLALDPRVDYAMYQ
jgi:hypothetical protein